MTLTAGSPLHTTAMTTTDGDSCTDYDYHYDDDDDDDETCTVDQLCDCYKRRHRITEEIE